MTSNNTGHKIILVPGHWLGAWAWEQVLEHLEIAGQRAVPLTLPGLDPADSNRASRTLSEQAAAIEQALVGDGGPAILVAHSGANAPVSVVIDRHPELVRRVIWVDSGPVSSGIIFAPDFPDDAKDLPLPPFDLLSEQASLEGLSAADMERFQSRAVPQPGPMLRQPVELGNAARFDVPTTFICCSLPSSQIKELIAAGHPMFAEVANFKQVEFADLPTGHWPMWSRPADLARIIAGECQKS